MVTKVGKFNENETRSKGSKQSENNQKDTKRSAEEDENVKPKKRKLNVSSRGNGTLRNSGFPAWTNDIHGHKPPDPCSLSNRPNISRFPTAREDDARLKYVYVKKTDGWYNRNDETVLGSSQSVLWESNRETDSNRECASNVDSHELYNFFDNVMPTMFSDS